MSNGEYLWTSTPTVSAPKGVNLYWVDHIISRVLYCPNVLKVVLEEEDMMVVHHNQPHILQV